MFRLRTAFLVVLLILTAGGGLVGQDKKADDKTTPKAKGKLPVYFKSLGLSDKQKQEVLKIHASYTAQVEELEEKIKKLKKDEKSELEKVLSDDQKARLRELRLGETETPTKEKPADKPAPPVTDKPVAPEKSTEKPAVKPDKN